MKSVHEMEYKNEVIATAGVPAPLTGAFAEFSRQLDLDSVIYKLLKEKNWELGRAREAEHNYKAFLFLIGQGHHLVPTADIDEMWHMHILDTQKYMVDCATHFGEFIHHYPFMGLEDDADAAYAQSVFDQTRALFEAGLGIDLAKKEASSCGGSSCGGGSSCSSGSNCSGGHSSCSSGHSSCSSGHHSPSDSSHGHHTPSTPSDSGWVPAITSCSAGSSDQPRQRDREPARSPNRPTEDGKKKKGIFRRILGLSPQASERWYASVSPTRFSGQQFRPDKAAVEKLNATRLN